MLTNLINPLKQSAVDRFMSKAGIQIVEKAIKYAESKTDGEICIHVVGDSKDSEGETPQERVKNRALSEFDQLEIQQTEGATGILILISVDEKRVEIVADKAINEKVNADRWEQEVAKIVDGAKLECPAVGLIDAITSIGRHLAKHFPKTHDKNELENTVTSD